MLLKRTLADNLFLRTEFVFLAYGLGKLLRGRKKKREEKPL